MLAPGLAAANTGPEVPLPISDGTYSPALTAQSLYPDKYSVGAPGVAEFGQVTMIPYSAFENAVRVAVEDPSNSFYALTESDEKAVLNAATVTGLSNDPEAIGLTAELFWDDVNGEEFEFSGNLFAVALDPRQVQLPNGQIRIESAQYFYVSANLRGTTPWAGTQTRLAMLSKSAPGFGECFCNGGGGGTQTIQCGPMGGNTGPCTLAPELCNIGLEDIKEIGFQPTFVNRIGSSIDPLINLRNFDVSLPSFAQPDPTTIIDPRRARGNGQPAIGFVRLQDAATMRNAGVDLQTLVINDLHACDVCQSFSGAGELCADWNVSLDRPSLGDMCHPSPNQVPDLCTQYMGGILPPECGGLPDLYGSGPTCFAPGPPGLNGGISCDVEDLLPDYCRYTAEGCFGDSENQQKAMALMYEVAQGCSFDLGTCDGSAVCFDAGGAFFDMCLSCTSDGHCVQSIVRSENDPRINPLYQDYDGPGIGGESPSSTEPECQYDDSSEDPYCNQASAAEDSSEVNAEQESNTPSSEEDPSGDDDRTDDGDASGDEIDLGFPDTTGSGSSPHQANNQTNLEDTTEDQPSPDRPVRPTPDGRSVENNPTNVPGEEPTNKDGVGGDEETIHDPIDIASGALLLRELDFSFPTPTGQLAFERFYNSQTSSRGILGSKWTHTYDVRLVPIKKATAPSWTPPYCVQDPVQHNCMLLRDRGATTLFIRDPANTAGTVYMPQAGSTDTLVKGKRGWVIRTDNGGIRRFNTLGYLVSDRDRFGNGVRIEYEMAPVFAQYDRICRPNRQKQYLDHQGAVTQICSVMAYWFDDAHLPNLPNEGMPSQDEIEPELMALPIDPGYFAHYFGLNHQQSFSSLMSMQGILDAFEDGDVIYYDYYLEQLRGWSDARKFVDRLLALDSFPELNVGNTRMRPRRVIDDLGRTLDFKYHGLPGEGAPLKDLLHFGMLASVHGPQGVTVNFVYDRPSNSAHPDRMADLYLISSIRADEIPTDSMMHAPPERQQDYVYNWSDGSPAMDKTVYEKVERSLLDYYASHRGCSFINSEQVAFVQNTISGGICGESGVIGGGGYAEILSQPGNACLLATTHAHRLLETVAGNLIIHTATGVTVKETFYNEDPFSQNFDRVTSQRFGGMEDPTQYGQDQTAFPRAEMDYASTYALVEGGSSSLSVPAELVDLFAYEGGGDQWDAVCDSQFDPRCWALDEVKPDQVQCGVGYGYQEESCAFGMYGKLLKEIPGYVPSKGYTERDASYRGEITVSPISCDSIYAAQVGDALHNGVIGTFDEIDTANGSVIVATYDNSKRQRVHDDSLRICSWTRSTNQLGVTTYYGVNYRGQPLITATGFNGGFAKKLRKYNADGNLTFETEVFTGTEPVVTTTYEYQTYDKSTSGQLRFTRPGFWTRRNNVLRVVRHTAEPVAATDDVGDLFYEAQVQEFTYEPLFNQVRTAKRGVITVGNKEIFHEIDVYDYDYQEIPFELEDNDNPVARYLLNLIGFGWEFSHVVEPTTRLSHSFATLSGTIPNFLQSQFDVHSYGSDLNGDNMEGFPHGLGTSRAVAGTMVRHTRRELATGQERVAVYNYAPHGELAASETPSGTKVRFGYYPRTGADGADDAYGPTGTPDSSDYSTGNTGFLAAIELERGSLGDESLELYVPELADRKCDNFPQELQFIFPDVSECGADVSQTLSALGLDSDVVQSLVQRKTEFTKFSYNRAGYVKRTWDVTGAQDIWRDSDGREVIRTLPGGLRVETAYNVDALPVYQRGLENGQLMFEQFHVYDGAQKPVLHGTTLRNGGCDAVFAMFGGRITQAATLASIDENAYPDCRLEVIERNAEGDVVKRRSSDSAEVVFEYDALRRVAAREVRGDRPGQASAQIRDEFLYDDGRPYTKPVLQVTSGADGLEHHQSWEFNAFGATTLKQDIHGEVWEFTYDSRGNLVLEEFVDNAHFTGPMPISSRATTYNGFNEPVESVINNVLKTTITRLPDGRPVKIDRDGEAPEYFTSLSTGEIVWSGDLEGNGVLQTRDHVRRRDVSAQLIREKGGAGRLVNSTVSVLNERGLPVATRRYDSMGQYRESLMKYDVLGRPVDELGENGTKRTFLYNVGGDLIESCEWDGQSPLCTWTTFDRAGRPVTIVDPGGTTTSLVHSELGELIRRDRAVANGPFEETIYDSLGRPTEILDRMGRSRALTYDPNTHRLLSDVGDEGEVFYDYDALGRVTWAQRVSPLDVDSDFQQATGFDRSASVEHAFTYDQLGRVHTEDVTIAGIAFPTIQRDHILFDDGREVRTALPYRNDKHIFDGRGRLESLGSNALPDTVEFDWMGDLYAGRVQGQGPFNERRAFNDFGELEAQIFYGASSLSMGEPSFVSDYCQGLSTCSDILLDAKYIRDNAGRLMERAFSYKFPTPVPRAAPSFNNQQFQYDTRGHLTNFVEERNSLDPMTRPVSTFEVDYTRGVHGSVNTWDTTFNTQNFVHDASRTADGRATAFNLDFGSGVTEPVKYDDRGFIAELGGFSFEYDQWQQLTSVHRKEQKYAESYLYDFAGRLVATIQRDDASGSTIDFLILDGEKLVEQWRGAASQSTGGDQLELRGEYFWGPLQQQMIAARTVDSDFDLVFTLTDALQSIIGVWNEDELRISEYAEYDPEGRISARAPDDTEDCSERNLAETPCHIGSLPHFGFTGAFRSTTTGLYRFGARWYSPRFGQFMSPDPLWYVDSFDVYGYAAFDPVNRWDPSGMNSEGSGDIEKSLKTFFVGVGKGILNMAKDFAHAAYEASFLRLLDFVFSPDQHEQMVESLHELSEIEREEVVEQLAEFANETETNARNAINQCMANDCSQVGEMVTAVGATAVPGGGGARGANMVRRAVGTRRRPRQPSRPAQCFVAGTGVYTVVGVQSIEKVEVDDMVVGYGVEESGEWTDVEVTTSKCADPNDSEDCDFEKAVVDDKCAQEVDCEE